MQYHDSRAAGASLVPIKHFHIPALILGDHVAPRRDSRLSESNPDPPTTLLSIAGVSGNYPMIGFDLTQDVNPDRAFMQFDQTQALMKGNHDVVIQTPNSKAKGYVYDKEKDTLTEKDVPEEMKKKHWHMLYLAAICIKTGYIKAVKRNKVRSVLS